MSFFIRFGLQDFTFDGETFRIEDLTKRVVNRPVEFFNQVYFQDYYIVRGTRPDILANTLYGDVNYWWAFFVVNNITANDWPMDDKDLELRIEEEYTAFELESRSRSRNADGQLIEGYRPKFTRVDGQLISHHYEAPDPLDQTPIVEDDFPHDADLVHE